MDDATTHVTTAASREGTDTEALIAQLQGALASRQLIGQATGVLIALYRISDTEAWTMLSGTSQNTNIKVARLAQALVQAASGSTTVSDAPAHAALRHLVADPARRWEAPTRRPQPYSLAPVCSSASNGTAAPMNATPPPRSTT